MELNSVSNNFVEETFTYNIQKEYSKFNAMRENGKFCDVKVITTSVNGNQVKFDAHRNVLDVTIPYFSGQFSFDPEKQVCFIVILVDKKLLTVFQFNFPLIIFLNIVLIYSGGSWFFKLGV